ncbi:NAD(P)H-dependent glycerol-3-phosphate dehydrogenase [Syntrophomonas palmitatica]|uniref:NAD(P)H-dependent glycerol-3-phosphate dehydrogenase n=1 Tax=Syntrophomonas palmitatica TaxID=402877 RepID=UPI0006CFCE2C|nr:NAD(P)H-dependent glycerol-3-phosphate dehydrogenase [Syntrophomonas palmitatica]
MKKICILGAGSWGTAQAVVLSRNVTEVMLWGRIEDGIEDIERERENKRFLPGVFLPHNIIPSSDLEKSLYNAEMAVLAVPVQSIRSVLHQIRPLLDKKSLLVNTAKGLEIATGMRMSQVFMDVLGVDVKNRYTVLSGPSHAEEVGRDIPTAVTVAAYKKESAFQVQDLFMNDNFRVYTNPDVAGVELGGALKNIVALATGICEGLGYGDNTKAALMTRGLAEMIRMGTAMGGDIRTFNGLSGMGDLVVTCGSRHSRNHRAGLMLAQGCGTEETLKAIGMVVEGIHTTKVVHRIAAEMKIDMPICQACYRVLYENRPPGDEVAQLMKRDRKNEIEETALSIEAWQTE